MLRLLLLAAVPPPAPPGHAWASPFTEFLWQVEEGPSSAKGWTALPRKPRRDAKFEPEAGRRRCPLEDGPPRTEHLERTHARAHAATEVLRTRRHARTRVRAAQSTLERAVVAFLSPYTQICQGLIRAQLSGCDPARGNRCGLRLVSGRPSVGLR